MNEGKSYAPQELGEVMIGGTVGRSSNPGIRSSPRATKVLGMLGWQQFGLSTARA